MRFILTPTGLGGIVEWCVLSGVGGSKLRFLTILADLVNVRRNQQASDDRPAASSGGLFAAVRAVQEAEKPTTCTLNIWQAGPPFIPA